jgi:hypothetical protein
MLTPSNGSRTLRKPAGQSHPERSEYMDGSQQDVSVVILRTASAVFKGKLQTPSRIRLSGYMNGPSPTVDLTEASMKSGPRSKEQAVGPLSIPKVAVTYVFLSEEEDTEACSRYEREAMEGRVSDEPYFLLLGPGVDVSARIFGGTHAVVRARSSFTSLDGPTLHDKLLGPKARNPQTMVVNVKEVECCFPVGQAE